jgi:hypothetical protein
MAAILSWNIDQILTELPTFGTWSFISVFARAITCPQLEPDESSHLSSYFLGPISLLSSYPLPCLPRDRFSSDSLPELLQMISSAIRVTLRDELCAYHMDSFRSFSKQSINQHLQHVAHWHIRDWQMSLTVVMDCVFWDSYHAEYVQK